MKNDFSKIKRKIILQVVTVAVVTPIIGAFILYFFIDGIWQAPFADWFLNICQRFGMSYEQAYKFYDDAFRQNKMVWLLSGFIVLLLLAFYFVMSRFTKYFDQISKGVNELLVESDQPIIMSDELAFMAKQLNEVKKTLKERQLAALESEQRKNDLVMYLAHDIKTPLTSVIGYLTLLEESPELPIEYRQKYTKICLDKSHRLETLMNEFFEITRFNLHEMVLEKEAVNLTFMFEQLVDEFYPNLMEKQLKVNLFYEEEIEVYADVDKLARVFNNVLKNAVAYSYPQSMIEINLSKLEGEVKMTFENQGKMIPKHKLETIFEKFYRLDSARTSNTGGAGLGLAISKEIVEAHSGKILATSDEYSTIFTIILPTS